MGMFTVKFERETSQGSQISIQSPLLRAKLDQKTFSIGLLQRGQADRAFLDRKSLVQLSSRMPDNRGVGYFPSAETVIAVQGTECRQNCLFSSMAVGVIVGRAKNAGQQQTSNDPGSMTRNTNHETQNARLLRSSQMAKFYSSSSLPQPEKVQHRSAFSIARKTPVPGSAIGSLSRGRNFFDAIKQARIR
jgi:hypothetical protein